MWSMGERGYTAYTFSDKFIFRTDNEEFQKWMEYPYTREDGAIKIGIGVEVEEEFVYKMIAEDNVVNKSTFAELTGLIISQKEASDERIAYAAVLVPGEPDHDFEIGEKILTEEEIERVANGWLENYKNIDLQHQLNNCAVPVQSYTTYSERVVKTANGDEYTLPKGTWILGCKVGDEGVWDSIKSGALTGYSVMGIKKTALKSASKSDNIVLKKTLLRDLGDDWIAASVAIVDEPCVPKAKFFSLKNKTVAPKTLWGSIKSLIKGEEIELDEKSLRAIIADEFKTFKSVESAAPAAPTSEPEKAIDSKTLKSEIISELTQVMKSAIKEAMTVDSSAEGEATTSTEAEAIEVKPENLAEAVKSLQEELKTLKNSSTKSRSLKNPGLVQGSDDQDEDRDIYGRRIK